MGHPGTSQREVRGWVGQAVREAESGKQKQKHRQSCVTVRVGLVSSVWDPLRWADEGWLPGSGKRLTFLEAALSSTESGSPLSWQLSSRFWVHYLVGASQHPGLMGLSS